MKFALVDGFSLIYRAYHALPPELATSKGERTNAVLGFCTMLLQVLERENPHSVAVAFDVGRAFRHDEYEQYKAHRPSMPDDLSSQIGRVRQVVEAFEFPIYQQQGYEADDLIGSLARELESTGHEAVVVTGDTDMLQLATEKVHIATPAQGRFSEVKLYTPDLVRERYGFPPPLVADYKALVGDTSDNIPGVPGVGDKTARTLIRTYGPVEQILEHVDELKPDRARRAISEHADQLRLSKRLATIVTTLDVDCSPLIQATGGYDAEGVAAVFRELEFRTLLGRLRRQEPSSAPAAVTDAREAHRPSEYRILRVPEEVAQAVRELRGAPVVSFDTETDSSDAVRARLVGVSFAGEEARACYVPLGHTELEVDREAMLDALSPLFEAPAGKLVAHNAKFDYTVLRRHGVDVTDVDFDTSVAAFLLSETSTGLKDLAATRLGVAMTQITALIGKGRSKRTMAEVPVEECGPYAAADADMTLRLHRIFEPELRERGLMELFERLEMPLIPVLADMEMAGVAVDLDTLRELAKMLDQQLEGVERDIRVTAGHDINLRSPQQLSRLLFEDLGLKGVRRTATGYSTDAASLEVLSGQHAVVDLILVHRQLSKLKDTYVDALPGLVNPDTGRVHTSFSQTSAVTGRLASTDPNLQNIPIRTGLGREVRRAFIASNSPDNAVLREPSVLLSVDYSQIELRVLAHLTGEQALVEAFEQEQDIHSLTAAQLYEVDLAQVTPEMRRTGKTINFGIIYGMSGFRLARDTGLSQKRAAEFVRRYMERFPAVTRFFEETVQRGRECGYVETPYHRRRYLPDLTSSNPARREAARRAAINMPIQGTAADIVKQAMIDVWHRLRKEQRPARLLLQVHDELLLEVGESDLAGTARCVMEQMAGAAQLSVPLRVDAKYGRNWGDMAPLGAV